MDLLDIISSGTVSFSKHIGGIIVRPYETYRNIFDKSHIFEIVCIAIVCAAYFSLASIVKTSAFSPLFLTKQFIVLSGGALSGYLIALIFLGSIGEIFKKPYTWSGLAVAWAYTFIPTVIWFMMNSVLYVVVPPPRTESVLGIGFSFFYLIITGILFFWKVELYYLTLRFGLHLDLMRIGIVTIVYIPILGMYSLIMYQMGIFRIPFI